MHIRCSIAFVRRAVAVATITGPGVVLSQAQNPAGSPVPVTVTNAWALPALAGGTGGAFMTVRNATGDVLRIAGATASVAKAVELHESVQQGHMSHMQMHATLDIAPRQQLRFAPGGVHVMLIGLTRTLIPGDTVRVILQVARITSSKSAIMQVPVLVTVRKP
jgi:copper(I)-binding protein